MQKLKKKIPLRLFYNNTSATSAILLTNSLRELGIELFATNNPERIKEYHTVIRYGNSLPILGKETVDTAEFISAVSNKYNFSELMKENKIYSPIYYRDRSKLSELNFPIMIRESLTSSGGYGISIANDLEEFNRLYSGWFTQFVNLDFELRVHVLGGKVVKIFRKEPMEGTDIRIKNNNSCHFSVKDGEKFPKLNELVERLSILFPGQFFGMDVGWDKSKKEYFVIEINSAPGLNEETAKRYAEYIKSILSGEKECLMSLNYQDTST